MEKEEKKNKLSVGQLHFTTFSKFYFQKGMSNKASTWLDNRYVTALPFPNYVTKLTSEWVAHRDSVERRTVAAPMSVCDCVCSVSPLLNCTTAIVLRFAPATHTHHDTHML